MFRFLKFNRNDFKKLVDKELTHKYNPSIDYKQFDKILKDYHLSMPLENTDRLFEYAFEEYNLRKCPYHHLKLTEFAFNWRCWAKQTEQSFWDF
jgi:hypothetical protein